MARTTSENGEASGPDRGKRSASRFGLRNWRVRSRLTALILVPTIVGVALAGTRVADSVDGVAGYQRTATAAEYSGGLRELAQALGRERDHGAWASFQPSDKELKSSAEEQRDAVDTLVEKVLPEVQAIDDSYGARAVAAARNVVHQLRDLPEVRRLSGTTRVERYSFTIAPLLRLHEELTLVGDDSEIVGNTRALTALAYAKEEVSRQRVRLLAGYYAPSLINPVEVEEFIASRSRMRELQADFGIEASMANSRLLAAAMSDEKADRAELTKSKAIVLAGDPDHTGRLLPDSAAVTQWFSDNAAVLDRMSGVEAKVAGDVVTRARTLEENEQRTAIITAGLILLLVLLVLVLTVVIARSMVTPLRRLRAEALEVAGSRLPEVVQRLRVSGETTTPDVDPISVESTDEIGEVARAFDEVHRQAVRLAAEESELRSNISAMFVNLSRRTQTLVERQISLIDGLEKGEEDGTRLADLFRLDHLATRMRRNSENLLVLAGHEPPRRRSQPAKLVDVVRAALSEIEDYERVQIKVHRAISVAGSAANDIVHLVAELVENALQFSSRTSPVVVSSSAIEGGGALLAISDLGIGMPHEELVETNRRLADPPVVDVSVSRRMGLFVVGRLALRHGIRVQLRPQEGGGLVAMVLLPPELVIQAVQPAQTPSWAGGQVASWDLPAQESGHSPVQRPSFGHDSFGQSSFGQSSFGQSSFEQSSLGQGPVPDASSFGSASLPGEYAAPSWSASAGPAGPPDAPAGSAAPLPKRQVDAPRAQSAQSGEPAPEFPGWNSSYENENEAGGMPTAGVSSLESEQEEYLPIFASIESAWFRREDGAGGQADERREGAGTPGEPETAWAEESTTPADEPERETTAPPAEAEPERTHQRSETVEAPDDWKTPADDGWRAAQAVSDPTLGGVTAAGLPKRTPRANLVPGTAGTAAATPSPMPPLSPDGVRSRLTSFQQGVRRGRAEAVQNSTGSPKDKEDGS